MTDDTRARELLPCPFCGEQPVPYDAEFVEHPEGKCPLSIGLFRPEQWNTRALASPRDGGVERAAQKVVDCYGVGYGTDYQAFTEAVGPFIMELRAALVAPAQPEQEEVAVRRIVDCLPVYTTAAQPVDEGQVTQDDTEAAGDLLAFMATRGVETNDDMRTAANRAFRNHRIASRPSAYIKGLEDAKAAASTSIMDTRASAIDAIRNLIHSSQGGTGK